MGCEVARIYKLSTNHVSTVNATVERKVGLDLTNHCWTIFNVGPFHESRLVSQVVQFHEDLFPATASNKPSLTSAEFYAGGNSFPFLLSPDPAKVMSLPASR